VQPRADEELGSGQLGGHGGVLESARAEWNVQCYG
jgi:hypothetical protein